jgi:hypothetical protein
MHIGNFFDHLVGLSATLVLPIIGVAVLVFLYGLSQYILNSSNESKREEGLQFIVYGLLGFVVMISLWALVGIISGTFGLPFGVPQIAV